MERATAGNGRNVTGRGAKTHAHVIGNLLNHNQVEFSALPASAYGLKATGRALLNTTFGNAKRLVYNAGIRKPYPGFVDNLTFGYPRYHNINTGSGGEPDGGR